MIKDYLEYLIDFENFIQDFKKDIIEWVFIDKDEIKHDIMWFYCYTPRYQRYFIVMQRIVEICDIFGIKLLERSKDRLLMRISWLKDPRRIDKKKYFEKYIDYIRNTFSKAKNEIKDKISLLSSEEKERLNEAIHCFLEGCLYSSIAMSVSAIEFRLLDLMMSVTSDSKLEDLTLGQLIREYLNNKKRYKNIIPKKHEALLELCNTYRIFSVHPKKEEITKAIANSILNLSFMFLLDKKLKKKIPRTITLKVEKKKPKTQPTV